jgi:hypothetical protein
MNNLARAEFENDHLEIHEEFFCICRSPDSKKEKRRVDEPA